MSNKDAQYIHLDNGRYEFYGLNPEGLTDQDFRDYYQQDLQREGNPGYNMIIKKHGGQWLNKYQDGAEVPSKYDLLKIDRPTAVAESTNVVLPNITNAPKQVAEVKKEAERVKQVLNLQLRYIKKNKKMLNGKQH